MTLIVNRVNAGDFFFNGNAVEKGYLNGQLFWERRLEIWTSNYLTGGQTIYWGYFNIDSVIQSIAPGFQGDVICHVDCPIVSTNVEFPLDAGPSAPYRGYRSLTIRIEPNGRVFGYGGYGGAGGVSRINNGRSYPSYPVPGDGKVHGDQYNRGGAGGAKGGDGGSCIHCRGVAALVVPGAWNQYILAGGGGGGGGAKLSSNHRAGGGGGGQGHNNAPGGPAVFPGGGGGGGAWGLGGRGDEGPNNYGGARQQPNTPGYGGLSVNWGENGWAPGNGGNGGTWNQSGGGGAMSLQLWTNWSNEGHFKGRDGNYAPSPTERGYSAAPGSRGSGHDYRRPWVDGGWSGHSGLPIYQASAIYYY